MANVGIRKYLNDQGYNDNQIGYNNGQVTLNGKNFYGATPQAADDASHGMMAGSTYGDQNALSNALKTYQGNDRSTMLNKTLGNMNDTVNTKTPFKFTQAKPFQYDTQSIQSDPLYQAAMRQATQGAQTAQNNAMVGLGSRGIGNSSVAVDRANQIQQTAVGHVNDTILPQLMQQAYTRYQGDITNNRNTELDNYGVGQDQLRNQSSFSTTLDNLGQQDFNNGRLAEADTRQKQQDHIDLAKLLTDMYGVQVDPKDDPALAYSQVKGLTPIAKQTLDFNQKISQQGADNSTRSTNATIANMSSDNARAASSEARAAGNQSLASKFDVWDRTGKAPAGIPGVAEGTSLSAKPTASTTKTPKINPKDSTDNFNIILGDLSTPGVTKEQAISLVQANKDSLSDSDYKAAMDHINKEF